MFLVVLVLLAVLAGQAHGQQPAPVINGDPLSCFAARQMDGAPSKGSESLVQVQGPGFTQALHVVTTATSANPWDIRPRCFNTLAVTQNDTLLAIFWMRTTKSQSGTGFTTFVLERNDSPYTKSVSFTVSAGSDWNKVEVPFSMAETYAANAYNFSFWVTFDPQEIEIGGLSIQNYGQNYPFSSLNLTNWPYEGHDLNAAWRATANDRIEKIRKADIAVVVRDENGAPVASAPVHVRMKRHAFGFGSAVAGAGLMGATADDQKYQQLIPQLFNQVVLENDLKWPSWERSRTSAAFALDWLPAHGITMVRGHNVIWPGKSYLPTDVVTLVSNGSADALRKRINDHIQEIMTWTKGKVTEWDVLNEPYNNTDVQKVLGDAEMGAWFQKAREADPGVKLYVNDYSITEAGGYDLKHQDGLFNIVKGMLDQGAPVDGIGLQSHFNTNLTPPTRVLEILDRFATFGKDLEVTEFDVNITDEQIQADYLRDYLTATFSHPAIKGFLMWGFWEGRHWLPRAAMYRKDWSIKPNGQVWKDLVFNKWWTDVQGTTDVNGVFRTRGFLGEYEVDATLNGRVTTVPLSVSAASQPNYAQLGKQVAGSITGGGIVNAASYGGAGTVAPGELVTIFGSGFGPKNGSSASYDAAGKLSTLTAETKVFFDGVQAPMVYSYPGQVSAVVPYSVSGTASVQIEYQGTRTNAVAISVGAAVPGVFTSNMTGAGQAVAVNVADNGATSFNSASQPADRGKYITLFLTGEGATNPPGVDGRMPAPPVFPAPRAAVSVSFGAGSGSVSKAPEWTGQIYPGVLQVNVRIPADAPAGTTVPLVVSVGGVPTQPNVTIAIR